MARRSKVVFCLLLAFLYVVVNIRPLRAEALPEVMSGSTTLADNILTYYALSGSAVANSEWINTLYNSYGSSFGTIEELAEQGYLVLNDAGNWEPVQQLGEMIEQAPAYQSLLLDQVFNVSSQEAAAGGGIVATGAATLAGSLGSVASTGVLPLFGGVTTAYWGGIAIGTLINHIANKYINVIKYGAPISDNQFISNLPISGVCEILTTASGVKYAYYVNNGYDSVLCKYGQNGDNLLIGVVIKSPQGTSVKRYQFSNKKTSSIGRSPADEIFSDALSCDSDVLYDLSFSNYDSYMYYLNGLRNGTSNFPKKFSPDIIGPNGNQQSEYDEDSGQYQIPNMKPQVDPGVQSGKPLTLQDWLNFANSVTNNNSKSNPLPDNKALFENLINAIKEPIPNPNPNPNPNPDPWSPPVVTPVPDPSYPDPVPDQQITEDPQESENPQQTEPLDPTDTGKPWRLPDLREKFPFCIPWDIAKVFSKLKVNVRQAPHISWRFNPPNTPIDYTFNLDLEDFEQVASLLRTLELMGFIVGLAFVTRYIIGAN